MITILFTLAGIGAVSVLYNLYKLVLFVQNKKANRLMKRRKSKTEAHRPSNFYKPDSKDSKAKEFKIYAY